jgi:hypothetical protein
MGRCGFSRLSSFSDTLTSGRYTRLHPHRSTLYRANTSCVLAFSWTIGCISNWQRLWMKLKEQGKTGHIPPMATSQTETCARQPPLPKLLLRFYIGFQVVAVLMCWAFCLQPSPTSRLEPEGKQNNEPVQPSLSHPMTSRHHHLTQHPLKSVSSRPSSDGNFFKSTNKESGPC